MKNPRHDARFEKYKTVFLHYICPGETRGLEIGAMDLPFVTPDEGNVEYLDHATTEELRERARSAPGHTPEFVVPVDYVLKNGGWVGVPNSYDWVAAAHVVEHAPSLIDWLRAVGDRLKEAGILFLVIPDRRYTFDFFRPESTLGKIFEDHFTRKTRPGISEVFDHAFYSRSIGSDFIRESSEKIPFHAEPTESALTLAKSAGQIYVDVHCNIFSDRSFSLIMEVLCKENWIPFVIEEIGIVKQFESDFHCVLKKVVRS